MKINKELLTAELDKMVAALGGIGTSVDISRLHYKHSNKLGWGIFIHDESGGCESFGTLNALEGYLTACESIRIERKTRKEILFRRYNYGN